MTHDDWMKMAVQMATDNVIEQHGGPFAALVVKHGQLIAAACNAVTSTCDPTAHAEVQAIRAACRVLSDFQLTDCDIYTSCEPCPMCFGAIYWARPRSVYYACTKEQAAAIGFDDEWILQQINMSEDERSIPMKQVYPVGSEIPFQEWIKAEAKTSY